MLKINRRKAVLFLTVLLFFVPFCLNASEVRFPVPAYTEEELAKVRQWEETWVGKKIDKSNIDQVAEFLPSSFVDAYKDPKKWGSPDEGSYFFIAPYKQYTPIEGMIEATKKYSPNVKVDAEGNIENFDEIAGVPFPEPKTGLEVAWNFTLNTRGDANNYMARGPVITPGSRIERRTLSERWQLYWIGRVDVEPKPAFADNRRGIHWGMFMHLFEPAESKDSRFFNIRYIDPSKDDDGYMYYAPFRRIRRIAVAQRTDVIDGSDIIYDDYYGWDGHIQRNTYTLTGRKEMLVGRESDPKDIVRQPGQAIPSNTKRSRLNTIVVEVINKDPNYVYSKRIWYVDPESWDIVLTEIYDDLGRYWKCFEYHQNDIKTEKGEFLKMHTFETTLDLQRTHSTLHEHEYKGVGLREIDQSMFTIQHLQRRY